MLGGIAALALLFGHAEASLTKVERKAADTSPSDRQTRAVVQATNSFLASLNRDQRQKVSIYVHTAEAGCKRPVS